MQYTRSPIVVREASTRTRGPVANDGAAFIERVAGLPSGTVAPWFTCVNLLRHAHASRPRAAEIAEVARASRRPILVAGRNAARAFGVEDPTYLTWYNVPPAVRLVVIPHPSSINRWWDEPQNRARFAAFMAQFIASLKEKACTH
jgi:hypothetical protein